MDSRSSRGNLGANPEAGVSAALQMAEAPIRVLHLRDSPWVDGPGRTILETGAHLDPNKVA
jgi:hypothetical protein